MKQFYEDYVNHMLRFYARYKETINLDTAKEVDKQNWRAVKEVLHTLAPWEQELVLEIFKRRDDLTDNVYEVSREIGMNQDDVWKLLGITTRRIAKERGLI